MADVVTVSPYIDDEIVGEPGFMFRLSLPVYVDGDVPDEVGLAIGRAAGRIYNVTVDGQEDPDEDGEDSRVEWALGPFIVEGGLTMLFDTDGYGCTPEMLQAMIRIFTEELATAGFPIEISGTGFPHDAMPPVWKSSDGREQIVDVRIRLGTSPGADRCSRVKRYLGDDPRMLMYNFTNLYIERVSRRRWWTEAYFLQVHVPSTTSGASPDTRTILKRAYFVGEPPVQMSGDAYNETMHDDRLWVQVEPERVTDYDSWLEVSSRHIPEPKGRLWNLLLIHLERDEHEVRQALSLGYHPTFAAAGSGDLIDDISWLESFTNELQPDGPTSAPLPPVEREEEPAPAADD